MRRTVVALVVLLAACSSSSRSSTTPTSKTPASTNTTARVALTTIASGLNSPIAIAWRPHDTRPYVVEQPGRVRIIADGRALPTPVLSVQVSLGNEQGLLGITFSSDGTKLYVDYTDPTGDSHIVEYTMRGDDADPATRRELLFQKQPFANHNGGEVMFGPDGMLYIGFGDGGSAGDPNRNGQNLGTWLGKILRIDPQPSANAPYTVPPDNPFVGRAGAKPEIWMYGLRNPWRFSFDKTTHDMWIGDVGQDDYEEVDIARASAKGTNWGWSIREALHVYNDGPTAGLTDPIVELPHSDGWCAVVGGYVYRGRAIPSLTGTYVYGDNCREQITMIREQGGQATAHGDLGLKLSQLTTMGEDPAGELYLVSRAGTVSRLTSPNA